MAMLSSQQISTLIERLNNKHPDARYELDWETPLQLLVGTILAAQCTDERVNKVTPALFEKYPTTAAFAEAERAELEELLKQTGFYRQKAKTVQEVCQALMAKHDGEVPKNMDDLVALPGVARKTANVVLNNAFRIPSGIIVDTHVIRVAPRMGLTTQTKPEKIEKDLMQMLGEEPETADGLAWSSPEGQTPTPAAEAFFEELIDDLGCWPSVTGDLASWAERGVLLWNAVPTRRAAKVGSHAGKGWEEFTRALLLALSRRPDPVVFALLGPKLAGYRRVLTESPCEAVLAPHPTAPEFRGSGLFSRINESLERRGESGIWWQLRSF